MSSLRLRGSVSNGTRTGSSGRRRERVVEGVVQSANHCRRSSNQCQTIAVPHTHTYLNLTNGAEAALLLERIGLESYGWTRLRSSLCEAGKPERLLDDLSPSLLVALALGESVLVLDLGSRSHKHGLSRAIWMGLEWIRVCPALQVACKL